jgi:hypothetical protein
MLSSLLIAGVCVFNGLLDSDTTHTPWHVGYDNGLSARYFFKNNRGIGLNLRPSGFDLYNESSNEESYNYDGGIFEQTNKSKTHGAQLFLEMFYQKKFNPIFILTPFVSIGGGFETYKSHRLMRQGDMSTDSNAYYREYNSENTTTLFSGSAGVMPGIKLGRFTAEFRLGIAAYYSKMKSPEGISDKTSSKDKRVILVYPSDFIRAIIIHFNI